MGFIFGGNTGLTYDDVQRKRAIVDRLYEQNSTAPRNVGEGLTAIGRALAGRHIEKQAAKADKANRAESDKRNQAILSSLFGQQTGTPYNPPAKPVPTPNPQNIPQGIIDAVDRVDPQYAVPTDWSTIQKNIFAGESGGDYDALYGYQNREGGKFAGTKVTDMTVDQALEFSDPSGPYAQSVKDDIGRVATPMGAYQVVGSTLRDAKKALGLTGRERMTPELQDRIGKYIYQTQGTGAWEGYQGQKRQQPTGQPQMAAIMQAMNDPYTDAGTKAMLQMKLQQQAQMSDPMYQAKLAQAQLDLEQDRSGAQNEFGLTPQYGTDKDGNLVLIQLNKAGEAKQTALPEGVALSKGLEKLDLGTHYQWANKFTGETIGDPISKDLAGAESEKVRGKMEGETETQAKIDLPAAETSANKAIALIDSVINDPALESITGNIQGNLPSGVPFVTGGQAGADLQVKIDQLKGQAFMEAYKGLKGGGQITEIEGAKAEAAQARLNQAQSLPEYIKALNEMKALVNDTLAETRRKAGVPDDDAAFLKSLGIE